MISPRKVSTLGIGFGIAAIAAIGLVTDAPVKYENFYYGNLAYLVDHDKPETKKKNAVKKQAGYVIQIPDHEEDDEEAIVLLVVSQIINSGLI